MLGFLFRLYVCPPNVNTRLKLLHVLLNEENLESGFSFAQLAEATEGYFKSDLKVLLYKLRFTYISMNRLGNVINATCSKNVVLFLSSSQNLCVAAARRPLKEFVEQESKVRTRK